MDEQQEGKKLGERLKNAGVHEIDFLLERVMNKPAQSSNVETFIRTFSVAKNTERVCLQNVRTSRLEEKRASHLNAAIAISSASNSAEVKKNSDDQKVRIKAHAMKVIAAEMLRRSDEMLKASTGMLDGSHDDSDSILLDDTAQLGLFDIEGIDPTLFLASLS